jgi:hypothetical protein
MALRFVDMVLSVQNGMDRLIRRLRRGAAAEVSRRRFVIVQIDGLSRAVLDKALAGGRMPFIRQLLRRLMVMVCVRTSHSRALQS